MTEAAKLSDIKYEEQELHTSVYINEDLIKELHDSNKKCETFLKKSKVYKIGDSIFEETESPNADGYVEFELYKEKLYDNTMDKSGCSMSVTDVSKAEDKKSDTPLNITIQNVPHGVIINSNVYLTNHQWNTMIFIDINMTKCAVCGIFCDLDSSPDHIQCYHHKKNLERYKPLEEFDLSITRKINKKYHCGVCNEMFHTRDMNDHEASKIHEGNLLYCINKVTDIMYDFNIHGENNNEKTDCYHFDANALYNNANSSINSYDDDDDDDADDDADDDDDDDDGTSINDVTEAFEGPSYASMASKPKLDIPKYLKIDLGNRVVRVKFDYWHMIIKTELNRFYCMICKIHDHIRYKTAHCINCQHVEKLAKCTIVDAFGEHLVRMVNGKLYHCGRCNNLQYKHEMFIHIESVHPKRNKNLTEPTKSCHSPSPTKIKRNKKEKTNENRQKENTATNRQSPTPKSATHDTATKNACNIDGKEIDIFGDILINPFSCKQTIPYLSYNVVFKRDGEYYCGLCEVVCFENLFEHIHSLMHIQILQMTPFIKPFTCNLIRAVRGSLHCTLCNVLVSVFDIYEHNMQSSHTNLVAKALGMIPNIKTPKEARDSPNQAQPSTSSVQTYTNLAKTSTSAAQTSTSSAETSTSAAQTSTSAAQTSTSAAQTSTSSAETSSSVAQTSTSAAQTSTCSAETSTSAAQTSTSAAQTSTKSVETKPLVPNASQSNTIIPSASSSNVQTKTPLSPVQVKSNLKNPQIDPIGTQQPVSKIKPIGTQNNISVPQVNPNDPQIMPKVNATELQNSLMKHETALIGAQSSSPLLSPARSKSPQIAPFGSQNTTSAPVFQNRPQLDLQKSYVFTNKSHNNTPPFSPIRSPNNPPKALKSPFSSQRNTPSPQRNSPNTKAQNSAQKESEALPQMSEVTESVIGNVLDDSLEDPYDTEEFVYVKLRNIYLRITYSSYNSLVHLGDTWRHCFVCSFNVEANELGRHVDSRAHLENVQKYKFLEKHDKHLLRQMYLTYHCSICNVLVSRRDLKSHLSWITHINQIEIKMKISKRMRKNEIKFGVKLYVVNTQKETIFLNEKEHVPKVHINALIVKNHTQSNKCKIIIFNDNVLKINYDHWNGITQAKTGGKCIVCQKELAETDLGEHLSSGGHKENLGKEFDLQLELALIRKVNDTILNCVICNIELPSSDVSICDHINGKKHIKNFEAMLKESSSCNTYTDCDEDILTLTN